MTDFKCPSCSAEHARGYVDGMRVFRCLNCGYTGDINAAAPTKRTLAQTLNAWSDDVSAWATPNIAETEYQIGAASAEKLAQDLAAAATSIDADEKLIEQVGRALRVADEVLKKERFAGLDQNPKAVRDLVGSARLAVDRWETKNATAEKPARR